MVICVCNASVKRFSRFHGHSKVANREQLKFACVSFVKLIMLPSKECRLKEQSIVLLQSFSHGTKTTIGIPRTLWFGTMLPENAVVVGHLPPTKMVRVNKPWPLYETLLEFRMTPENVGEWVLETAEGSHIRAGATQGSDWLLSLEVGTVEDSFLVSNAIRN